MAAQLGNDCKTYFSTTSVGGSPTWTEWTDIEEDSVNQERNAAEIANRASDWVKILAGKRNATVEITATYNKGNAAFEMVRDAFNNNTMLAVSAMTGNVATAGEEGLQADCRVVSFQHQRPLQDGCKVTFTLRPDATSSTDPSWNEISS